MSDTITIGADLQNALFAKLDAHQDLKQLFSAEKGAREALPRMEFEKMESAPHAEAGEGVYQHEITFSIWTPLYDSAEGMRLSDILRDWLEDSDLTLAHSVLVALRWASMRSRKDRGARYHQHQVTFSIVTELKT